MADHIKRLRTLSYVARMSQYGPVATGTARHLLSRLLSARRILGEAQAALEEIHPGVDVQKRFTDMREAFDDTLVTGWEELEAGILLPDSDDRQVVAAAIRADAQAIVTFNVDDFPGETLSAVGLEAVHPDDFLLDQLDLPRQLSCRSFRNKQPTPASLAYRHTTSRNC